MAPQTPEAATGSDMALQGPRAEGSCQEPQAGPSRSATPAVRHPGGSRQNTWGHLFLRVSCCQLAPLLLRPHLLPQALDLTFQSLHLVQQFIPDAVASLVGVLLCFRLQGREAAL